MRKISWAWTWAIAIVVGLVVGLAAGCRQSPQYAERPWGQGYETAAGYMQPDHSWLYYYWMYHTFQTVQPTYHVYTPPPGYASTHRPWHAQQRAAAPQAPTRSTGGFSRPATTQQSAPTRSTGGFSQPSRSYSSPSQPSRSTGGFSSPSRSSPSSPSRSSGGFSGSSRSSTPSRSSGGFSKR